MKNTKIITHKITITTLFTILTVMLSGCSFTGAPRPRLGSYATSTPRTRFIDLDTLGTHYYEFVPFSSERSGIAYTCRGGHIDVAHVRICADYTRYLYEQSKEILSSGGTEMTFKLNVEPSMYFATFEYPDNWDELSDRQREEIIDKVSLSLGKYFTHIMNIWHETLTWFGFKSMGIIPEYPSAFSWEDIYSNVLGIYLGAAAATHSELDYNEAMTKLLYEKLEYLGAVPRDQAKYAAERMRGEWFTGNLFVDMRRRNMDVGFRDGIIRPILSKGMCEDEEPKYLIAPNLDLFHSYGFSLDLQIEPRVFEQPQILRIIYPDGGGRTVDVQKHFPIIMDFMKEQASQRGYDYLPNY